MGDLNQALSPSRRFVGKPVVLLFHVTAQQHTTAYSVSVIFLEGWLLGGKRDQA